MDDDEDRKRLRKALLIAAAFAVVGVAGAYFSYQSDMDSLDFIRMTNATAGVELHLTLWSIAAVIVFFIYRNRK